MFKPKVLAVMLLLIVTAVPIYNVKADTFVWWGYVYSNGDPVTSITSVLGQEYRIVASEVFEYNDPLNYAADAMYYTDEYPDSWDWVSHYALPHGHSFLQINGGDVDWGPFSNGDTYHTYTISYTGDGNPIIFKIEDWIDGVYSNNHCHLRVMIYEEETLRPGYTPGFWKHNIGVALGYNKGAYSAFRDGTKLTLVMLQGYAATVGVTLQEAYEDLTAIGPGMDTVRADMANAFNAAAGYGPF
jgi:hypothetical protein